MSTPNRRTTRNVGIPAAYNRKTLRSKNGAELESHYVALLRALGTRPGNFNLDKSQKAFLKHEAFHGNEIVANTRRFAR